MAETKALATVTPIKSGAPVLGIVPRSIEEVVRLAKGIEAAQLAPRGLDTWPKIMAVIMGGAELGLPPMQSLQSFALINNRLAIWGDAIPALLRSRGFKLKEWYEGEGDTLTAHCEVTRPDTGEVIPGEFSVSDAKSAKLWSKQGPWQEYPKRMLKMRARSWAARDGAADVLRGVQVREEVADYQTGRDVTPPAEQLALESHADEAAEIEIIDATPIPPAPSEPPAAETVEVVVEANALETPATPHRTVPRTPFATQFAKTWRDRIAEAQKSGDAASLSALWSAPANKTAGEKVQREDATVADAVSAEVLAAISELEALAGVEG